MKCERPKTKLELFFQVFKIFFEYLDNNKLEAVILSFGVAGFLIAIGITKNIDKIKEIVEILK